MKILDIISEAFKEGARLFVESTNYDGPIETDAIISEEGFLMGNLLVKYSAITAINLVVVVDADVDEYGAAFPVYELIKSYTPDKTKPYNFI